MACEQFLNSLISFFFKVLGKLEKRQMFLKAPLAPTYTSFEGRARTKKRYFLVETFKKVPKNVCLWPVFFQNFAWGAENLGFFPVPPFSKYRVLCLIYVLLRLNA